MEHSQKKTIFQWKVLDIREDRSISFQWRRLNSKGMIEILLPCGAKVESSLGEVSKLKDMEENLSYDGISLGWFTKSAETSFQPIGSTDTGCRSCTSSRNLCSIIPENLITIIRMSCKLSAFLVYTPYHFAITTGQLYKTWKQVDSYNDVAASYIKNLIFNASYLLRNS